MYTCSFQYQKGAIKTLSASGDFSDCSRFQYQKGAIKTTHPDPRPQEPSISFQYQKGAIKTTIYYHLARNKSLISIPKRCD